MKYKWVSGFLAAVLALMLVGCGEGGRTATPLGTLTPPEAHHVTNGLHKVSVTETGREFIVNGTTQYKLVVPDDGAELRTAAGFIRTQLTAATGGAPELLTESEVNASEWDHESKYIVMGVSSLIERAGLDAPDQLEDDIGQSGYYIASVGDSVFLQVLSVYGWQQAAIAFLRHTVGYDMIAGDTVIFEKDGSTLPDLYIIESPDFQFRVQGNQTTSDARYGMGFVATNNVFAPVGSNIVHNAFDYLPKTTYQTAYPEWYSTDGTQLCYTARGDRKGTLDEMVGTVADVVIDALEANPTIGNITFTQQDTATRCTCDGCNAIVSEYGTISAAIIQFCNGVDDIVQEYLQCKAEESGTAKREFNLLFFAYHQSEAAPVTKLADGTFRPIDESVVCNEHVGVYIAPIRAAYNQSFYDETNITTAENIQGWTACSRKLYMWLYETNFHYYFYPLNNYDSMIETYRFCKENGAIYMMNQGQYNQGAVTHFSRLKEYINAVAQFDVNAELSDITDRFFTYYFRDAAQPMREFYDQLVAHLRMLENAYPVDVNGNIYNNMEQARFWPKKTLDGWLALCDQAYEAIAHYQEEDPELYAVLSEHILLETIFPRFALLELYSSYYDSTELFRLRTQFKEDCTALNIRQESETGSIATVWASWGV